MNENLERNQTTRDLQEIFAMMWANHLSNCDMIERRWQLAFAECPDVAGEFPYAGSAMWS